MWSWRGWRDSEVGALVEALQRLTNAESRGRSDAAATVCRRAPDTGDAVTRWLGAGRSCGALCRRCLARGVRDGGLRDHCGP